MTTLAEVRLWGRTIGAVSWAEGAPAAVFEYEPAFVRSGIDIAPLVMPLSNRIYSFPALARDAFLGLPGLLADSLPDRFGSEVITAWLASQGRVPETFNAVERLCFAGTRGMGALEYAPVRGPLLGEASALDLDSLVRSASAVLSRQSASEVVDSPRQLEAFQELLRIGTAAGGARAKAVIAWNSATHEIRSGHLHTPPGFENWILKFDGVSGNKDKELDDGHGFAATEYAYSLMARAAGIWMSDCRLLEEGGRRHFMTRRFERTASGGKLHMQSFAALCHFDFNDAHAHSYEQLFDAIKRLKLPMQALEEQCRRMLFNVVARNQDDHVKNIAFLMDPTGRWSLSPAFDITFSFNPQGAWTARHQMSINGKRDDFTLGDFKASAAVAGLKRGTVERLLSQVCAAVAEWPQFAARAQVPDARRAEIGACLRLKLGTRR